MVTPNSNKPAWWLCGKGHHWEAQISSRHRGKHRCPYCAGNKAWPGFNDLATLNPELAAEWHPIKNETLTPDRVLPYSSKSVWWICRKGHSFPASIANRSKGEGCPYCSVKKVIVGETDLGTTHPHLALEWDFEKNSPLSPQQVSSGSDKKVWWICPLGHSYDSQIKKRALSGQNCSICSGHRIVAGINDLVTTHPDIAKQWHPTKNAGINDLVSTHPDIAKQWHPTKNGVQTPNTFSHGSDTKVWWICDKGHEWPATISSRTNMHSGCPICSGERKTSFEEQTVYFYLSKVFPDCKNRYCGYGFEIDCFIPSTMTGIEYDGARFHKDPEKDSRKNQLAKEKGIKLIRIREPECPKLDGSSIDILRENHKKSSLESCIMRVLELLGAHCSCSIDIKRDSVAIYELMNLQEKLRSLASVRPDIAAQWHPVMNGSITSDRVSFSSKKEFWWICEKGHTYSSAVGKRTHGRGCPYCAGNKLLVGENDLASVNPHLAAEWHPSKNGKLLPQDVFPNSNKEAWWQCAKGHEWPAKIYSRNHGCGCPFCAGSKPILGETDLFTTHPTAALFWHSSKNTDLNPENLSYGSNKKVVWSCRVCEHEWKDSIKNFIQKGACCPICKNQKQRGE